MGGVAKEVDLQGHQVHLQGSKSSKKGSKENTVDMLPIEVKDANGFCVIMIQLLPNQEME